jgi:chromosome segregation ATPase
MRHLALIALLLAAPVAAQDADDPAARIAALEAQAVEDAETIAALRAEVAALQDRLRADGLNEQLSRERASIDLARCRADLSRAQTDLGAARRSAGDADRRARQAETTARSARSRLMRAEADARSARMRSMRCN